MLRQVRFDFPCGSLPPRFVSLAKRFTHWQMWRHLGKLPIAVQSVGVLPSLSLRAPSAEICGQLNGQGLTATIWLSGKRTSALLGRSNRRGLPFVQIATGAVFP